MKINETVLWVAKEGRAYLRGREANGDLNWQHECPFRRDDRVCGSWCPLFEVYDDDPESHGVRDVRLGCGQARMFHALVVVEEVKPCT